MNTATHGTTRGIRKIDSQAPGARRWAAAYGEKLVCVRYRLDPQRQRRLTRVEVVIDEGPTPISVLVGVHGVGRRGAGTRSAARGRHLGLFFPTVDVDLGQAKALGLVDRIVSGRAA